MATILVIAEQSHGHLKKATLNALTAAQQLAQKNGATIQGVAIGAGAQQAAQELAAYVGTVYAVEGAGFEHAIAETHSAAAAEAAKKASATDVVIAATAYGKDIAPRIAAKLSAGVASDILGVVSGNQFKRAMWAGNAIATVEVTTPVKVITVRATEFAAAQKAGSAGNVQALSVSAPAAKTRFIEFNEVKSARPELTEASAVVSGGRGTKGDFKAVEALADVLGAAVGASRAVVDAGWQPNDLQVGQTGKVVAPKLYIAAGISGAIQHLAGMKGSKTIVAINKDPEAPIFQVADYGLVADLFKALPELTEEVKKLK
ncbi:MAG TPA: electron transfer flavoprotein subunit alpha/FixB family protein [Myxococcales bacterium]|jgi:electron transfer flavoprotein alpha subunit|nr:electron transfer flavoprotein subunit alpha/FixB family protein [Myxococcales bacterium]